MAKTTGPLMSEKASGTFANTVTFTRRGVAHAKNSPGNQYTASRGNARQIFKATSKALHRCAPATIAAIRSVTGCGPNWRAAMTAAISGKAHATWSAVATVYGDQLQAFRDAWQAAAAATGFSDTTLAYASDPLISAGLSLYELATALYGPGVIVSPGAPAGSNADAWAVIITGESAGPPANALTLAGEVLTLAGETLTLGA